MGSWIENELIELINSDQFRLSIPIQFQFKIFQFNSNSIHAELNWIDYQFQFNSWIDPSPGCLWHIYALIKYVVINSDNGVSPVRGQIIIGINVVSI